jgi:hypothetical protein
MKRVAVNKQIELQKKRQEKLDAENKMQLALCKDQDAYNWMHKTKFIEQSA